MESDETAIFYRRFPKLIYLALVLSVALIIGSVFGLAIATPTEAPRLYPPFIVYFIIAVFLFAYCILLSIAFSRPMLILSDDALMYWNVPVPWNRVAEIGTRKTIWGPYVTVSLSIDVGGLIGDSLINRLQTATYRRMIRRYGGLMVAQARHLDIGALQRLLEESRNRAAQETDIGTP